MAISKIEDVALRERLQEEASRLIENKKFGLVFEEHIPECAPLYEIKIKKSFLIMPRWSKRWVWTIPGKPAPSRTLA